MLIKPFRFTPAFPRCYYLKKITFRSHAGKNTKDENIFWLGRVLFMFFFLSLSRCARPWEEKVKSRREEGYCSPLDFWSVFIGLGSVVLRVQASSRFSSFVLSKVCPMHWGFVWGGRRHIAFCLLSRVGGWGIEDWGYNRSNGSGGGGPKANLEWATALQSCYTQRLIKRNFM